MGAKLLEQLKQYGQLAGRGAPFPEIANANPKWGGRLASRGGETHAAKSQNFSAKNFLLKISNL